MTAYEENCAKLIAIHEQTRPIYRARVTEGVHFSVPRENKEPVDVLLHRPRTAGPHPVFLNMHGGAFCGLDAVVLDDYCQMLCDTLGMFVVNVNYRKTPECPYPYAIREICDTAYYFRDHAAEYDLDATKFAVGGSSAGGSLAAGAALLARDEGKPFACQVLVYPCTDQHTDIEQRVANVDPAEAASYHDMNRMYCQHDDSLELYASPLLGTDEQLAGVCPAIFLTCEFDSLREQGEAYAKRLLDLGVPVAVKRFPGALHGFVEVNRESFFHDDPRKTPEQAALARDAERFIRTQLTALLGL